jgi:histidinol-phosphate aminotransferase
MPAPPPARPEVESLQAYSAPLEGRRGLLRLDFNENTVGPSPKVVEAIRAIPADQYAIYPEYDGLREAVLASVAAMPGASVAAAPSVAPLPSTAPSEAPVIRADGVPAPGTVSLPQQPARRPSLRIEQVGLFNGVDAAILLCNPNNPTGTRLAPEEVLALATAAPHTLVVVYELYEAFTGDSVLPLLAAAGNADSLPPIPTC